MIKSKKALELSITFLVSLIIGIVLLGIGFVFVTTILSGAEEIQEHGLPSTFDYEAEACVDRGDKVCIPIEKKETETGKSTSFGIVINNIYGSKKVFKTFVVFRRGVSESGEVIDEIEGEWTFDDFAEIELENNDHQILEIPVRPPKKTPAGTYTFNINVCFDADDNIDTEKCSSEYKSLYAPTNQISVVVK